MGVWIWTRDEAETDVDEVVRRLTTVKGGGAGREKPTDDEEVVIRVVEAVTPGGRRVGPCGD